MYNIEVFCGLPKREDTKGREQNICVQNNMDCDVGGFVFVLGSLKFLHIQHKFTGFIATCQTSDKDKNKAVQ